MKTKQDLINYYKLKLSTDTRWALQALKRIAENQTKEELTKETTKEDNGIGFTGVDAEILTSFYKQTLNGWNLSDRQLEILMKKIPKYASQLLSISLNEGRVRKEGKVYVMVKY